MEDRRTDFNEKNGCRTILEYGTGQTIFVNRRAVKRLSEPRWRHSLRAGERISFAKVGGLKGFWAASIMRMKEEAPLELWEEGGDHHQTLASSQVSWAEPTAPMSTPQVSGSVYAIEEATIHLVIHTQAAAPV